jgi:hypothetical protein
MTKAGCGQNGQHRDTAMTPIDGHQMHIGYNNSRKNGIASGGRKHTSDGYTNFG